MPAPCVPRNCARARHQFVVRVATHIDRIEIGVRRTRREVFAEDFGGDALGDFADDATVGEEEGVPGVGLDVDEARGECETTGVDAFIGGFRPERIAGGDGDNAITADADVAVVPRVPGAVDDLGVGDDDVVRLARVRVGACQQAGQRPEARGQRKTMNSHAQGVDWMSQKGQ